MKKLFLKFFVLLFCLPALWLGAQSQSCSDWAIQISNTPLQVGANDDPTNCSADDCFTAYFYVYLIRNGKQNMNGTGDYSSLTFNNLYIEGDLSVQGPVGLRFASNINVNKSVACTPTLLNNPGDPNSPLLGYDQITKDFTYTINAPTTWNMAGRRLLFTLAVDGAVGHTVKPDVNGCAIGFLNGLYCDPVTVIDDSFGKTIAAPASVCFNATLGIPVIKFSEVSLSPTPGHPNRKLVPVWVSGPASGEFEVSQIDFLFTMMASSGMHVPKIVGNILPASSVTLNMIVQNMQYAAYTRAEGNYTVKTDGLNMPNAGNTLFYLEYDGPVLASECLEIQLSFVTNSARINGNPYTCCKPNLGNDETIHWTAPGCTTIRCEEVTIYAENTTNSATNNCINTLVFDLKIGATQSTGLDNVACRLQVKKSGTFSLNVANSSSSYCTSMGTCVTVTDVSPSEAVIDVIFVGMVSTTNPPNPPTIGTGAGTPLLLASLAMTIQGGGCIEGITFLDAKIKKPGEDDYCLTAYASAFDPAEVADDICTGSLTIKAKTRPMGPNMTECPIETWSYYINQSPNSNNPFDPACRKNGSGGDANGSATVCPCVLKDTEQNVALYKNDSHINGVSTFDLLLISKHLLGIEEFNDGFKLLAADVNLSATVTNFDIIEARKLILGIYDNFPNNRSWRFFDKDLEEAIRDAPASSLPNPLSIVGTNEDYPGVPEDRTYATEEFDEFSVPVGSIDDLAEFIGIKVGDVNYSAIPSSGCPAMFTTTDDRSASALTLGIHRQKMKKGAIMEIPVFWTEAGNWSAWQLALGYDPEQFEFLDLRWPDSLPLRAMRDRAWHQPQAGELRVLCYDAEKIMQVQPGNVAFYVKVKVKKNVADTALPFFIRNSVMPSEVYDAAGAIFRPGIEASDLPLRESVTTPRKKWAVEVYPNPAATQFRLNIDAPQPCEVTLLITDLLGNTVHRQVLPLQEGANTLNSQQLPSLKAGQYFCTLNTPQGVQSVRLIRQ